MKKSVFLMSIILILFITAPFAGCGGGGGGDSATNESDANSGTIGTAGGTVVSSDGNVTLSVPPNALNDTTEITIKESTVLDDIGATGKTYDFSPDGTQFNVPAHVKIIYDPSSLPSGINEADLTLAYFTDNGWEIIGTSVVNQIDHTIEADIAHFSTIGENIRNPYPQTLVKEADFEGHLAASFRMPIGDDGTTDLGNDISLLNISSEETEIEFNKSSSSNGWYVATTFNEAYFLGQHPGEDWNLSTGGSTDEGKPVHAIANGIVLFDGWKWGHTIILGHKLESGEIIASLYAHLQIEPDPSDASKSKKLEVGTIITKGTVIGNIGHTGTTGGSHLHFEIAKGIGNDGTSYLLEKNSDNEIIFKNEKTFVSGEQKYYSWLWPWPGFGQSAKDEINEKWYAPSKFIKSLDPITALLNSLVYIPAGSFMMGSEDNEYGYAQYTTPVHEVTLSGFYMGAYEVTQAQYEAVMRTNPSYFQGASYPDSANRPVEQVSWYDARAFCQQLSALTGRTFTLPSEAQWEYACRAGTTTLYSFGDNDTDLVNYAWYSVNSDNKTHPVGTKLPNPWGLYDMHGNVWEWCLDSWHSNYTGAPNDGSAWEPDAGSYRMVRGGTWFYDYPWYSRSAARFSGGSPGSWSGTVGFRVLAVR